jgi:hypothetical protein
LVCSSGRYFQDLDFSIGKYGFVKEIQLTDWDGDGDQAGVEHHVEQGGHEGLMGCFWIGFLWIGFL